MIIFCAFLIVNIDMKELVQGLHPAVREWVGAVIMRLRNEHAPFLPQLPCGGDDDDWERELGELEPNTDEEEDAYWAEIAGWEQLSDEALGGWLDDDDDSDSEWAASEQLARGGG